MLIPLYWILGYLGCALFTMLICPPIVWMLDSHLKSGTYKEMWDYTYKGDDNPEEYSIRANQVDYEERCAYYAELRARKAWKKAHLNQTRFTYRSW